MIFIYSAPLLILRVWVKGERVEKSQITLAQEQGFFLHIEGTGSPALIHALRAWLMAYVQKENLPLPEGFDVSSFSPFTKNMFAGLQRIPFGVSTTYAALALELGFSAASARAVGRACGVNPFPLFIPCHRVLRAGAHLGGFRDGLEIKKRLLQFENIG
jgi:O-6-methylguanine DNA methyltransferase